MNLSVVVEYGMITNSLFEAEYWYEHCYWDITVVNDGEDLKEALLNAYQSGFERAQELYGKD